MVLLNQLSIRTKLSLALIISGLSLLATYIFLAKDVFETDKKAYVFETQNVQIQTVKHDFSKAIEKALLASRAIVATYDTANRKITPVSEQIFKEDESILALELWSEKKNQTIFKIEKTDGSLPAMADNRMESPIGQAQLLPLNNDRLLVVLRYQEQDSENVLRMHIVLNLKTLVATSNMRQSLVISNKSTPFFTVDFRGIDKNILARISSELGDNKSDLTKLWGSGSQKYLVSAGPLGANDFSVFILTPEKEALGALGTLFNRSLIFIVFSFFGLVIISFLLARSLTKNLETLTLAVQEIGKGNLDVPIEVASQDEVGILAGSFAKMCQEVKRLLFESRESARMEGELKTARLVQDQLLPQAADVAVNGIEISGRVVTSSECGGDWWHYFVKGDNLYIAIADATGHGTAAALITAAARSVFSRLETETLTLVEMLVAWDLAVASCSGKQVYMTALLMKIDTRTGQYNIVNASHEFPILFRGPGGEHSIASLDIPPCPRLGDGIKDYVQEKTFQLNIGDSLVLYTDGLFSVTDDAGHGLGEKRFVQGVAALVTKHTNAVQTTECVLSEFDRFRAGRILPDDVSVVSIRRKK